MSLVKKEILLIDDDDNDIELFLLAAQRLGYEGRVATAQDGVEALEYLGAQPLDLLPKLLVIDCKMPRMDGMHFLQVLKEDKRLDRIPAVMLTSSRDDNDISRAYAAGANAYLLKPVNFNQFNQDVAVLFKFWLELNLIDRADSTVLERG